jgi:glucose-1-phosphate thymidylyltransferase
MAVTRVATPSQYGVVDVEDDTIQAIEEQPIPDLADSDLINAGVYAFSPDIFAAIRRVNTLGEQALTDALEMIIDTQRVQAVPYDGLWADVSVPWDLLTVSDTLLAREGADATPKLPVATRCETAIANGPVQCGSGVEIESYTTLRHSIALGDNVRLYPNVTITNSILLSDATVKSGAVITDSIIGANTTVGPNTTIEGGPATVTLDGQIYNDVTFGGLLGDNVDVGANVTIQPGTVVGSETTIGSGTYVSEQIDDHSYVTRG